MISIIAIIISSIIMFISPLVLIADRSDDISQLLAQTATTEFVNEVITSGQITTDNYQRFVSSLYSSGNTYEIDMEVKILDETTAQQVTKANSQMIGNNSYYSLFTSQIEEKIGVSEAIQIEEMIGASEVNQNNNITGKLNLKQGDGIFVTVKNNSKTLSQVLKNFYYNVTEGDLHIIAASSSGTININGAT